MHMGFAVRSHTTKSIKPGPLLALCLFGLSSVPCTYAQPDFDPATSPVFDAEPVFATDHYHQHFGKSLFNNWSLPLSLWQKTLTVETAYVEKPEAPATPESMGALPRQRSLLKLRMAAPIFDKLLSSEGKFSYSFLSREIQSGLGNPQNRLARLRFTGDWRAFNYGAELRSVGRHFIKLNGPPMTPDREGGEIWTETKFGPLKLRAAMGSFWDNLEHDSSRSQMTRSHGNVTVNFSHGSWPSLRLVYTRAIEASSREPVGAARRNRWIDIWQSSVQGKFHDWHPSLTSSLSIIRDRWSAQNTFAVQRHRIAAAYRPIKAWEFIPSFTWEEVRDPANPSRATSVGLLNRFQDAKLGLQWTTTAVFNRRTAFLAANNTREFQLKSSLGWLFQGAARDRRSVSLLFDYRRADHETTGKSEHFSI
jgi:hypothetical protein